MLNISDYYKDINVQKRQLEYCGVQKELLDLNDDISELIGHMTAEYLVGWGGDLKRKIGKEFQAVDNSKFNWILNNQLDPFRAVRDTKSTLGVLDVEYCSKKYPGDVYLDQNAAFWKIEPLYQCLKHIMFSYGIKPLTTATGQGYHLSFRVDKETAAHKSLESISHVEETLVGKYCHVPFGSKRKSPVFKEEAQGYDGMGRLMEYLFQQAIKKSNEFSVFLPITLGDVAVGNERMESLSIDLSAYANPIFMRDVRLPFGSHQKHKFKKEIGLDAQRIPIQVAVPRYTPFNDNELKMHELFENRRHYRNCANYAATISTEIPECGEGVLKMISDYKKSKLYEFHQDYDKTKQELPEQWPRTYDKFELEKVPPCVSHALAHPNPHLLQPAQIQTVVRILTGKQWWHPKHVAGLIRSKYERNHGWEIDFNKYDANAWATIWTRMYSGLLATGLDQRTDQNCISHQEKGQSWDKNYCVKPNCGYDLGSYK